MKSKLLKTITLIAGISIFGNCATYKDFGPFDKTMKEITADVIGDEKPEKLIQNKVLVSAVENPGTKHAVYNLIYGVNPKTSEIIYFDVRDVDCDGQNDLVFSVREKGAFGKIHKFWIRNDRERKIPGAYGFSAMSRPRLMPADYN